MRKGEIEMVQGTESEQVDEDVKGWVEVRRRTRRRVVEEGGNDEGGKSRKKVQIFVKMDGSRTIAVDVSPNDKVSDMMKRIPNGGDMYVTSDGKVLRRSDKLGSCGVSARCTIQVMSRMRGGGRHKDKKNRNEKQQATSAKGSEQRTAEEPESGRCSVLPGCGCDTVDQMV